jgi:hypothetical protein
MKDMKNIYTHYVRIILVIFQEKIMKEDGPIQRKLAKLLKQEK